MKKPQTAQMAGILGVFLGWAGAHDWYLGRKKPAIIHTSLAAGSILLAIIAGLIIQSVPTTARLLSRTTADMQWGSALTILSYLIAAGNTIWGIVEGIILLQRGEKALVPKSAPATVVVKPTVNTTPENSNLTPATPVALADNQPVTPTVQPASTAAASVIAPTVVAPKPPKKPLNPATKKKIILWSSIGGGALVLGIIAWVVIALVTRVDYGDTYRVANELRAKVNSIYQEYGCGRAVDYADSTWVSERTYNSYVSDCKEVLDGVDDMVKRLSETSGVKRNEKISNQFNSFQEAYHAAIPDIHTINEKLDLYQAWHTFTVKVDDLTAKSTDAEFKTAADILAKSGNPTMAAYGEGWLERTLAYAHAYQAYWDAPSDAENKTQLRNDMNNKQSEQRLWISENRPDVAELVGLEFNNTSKMYNSYRNLFSTIADAYERHYDFGSGDCTELFDDVVICE